MANELPEGYELDSLPPGFVIDQAEQSLTDDLVGGAEGALTMIQNLGVDALAGWAGMAGAANPFASEGEGGRMVDWVQQLKYEPSERGRKALAGLLDIPGVEKALTTYEALKTELGDDAIESLNSPMLAALLFTAPDAALEALGFGAGKRLGQRSLQSGEVSRAKQGAMQEVENIKANTGIDLTTSDVSPPQGRISAFAQQRGEFIRPGLRAKQQKQRIEAVDQYFERFDVDLADRYERQIVDSVKNSINKQKRKFGTMYEQSSKQLDQYGAVNTSGTKAYAQKILDQQSKLGSRANKAKIEEAQSIIDMPDELTFDQVKLIRSEIGSDLAKAKSAAPVTGSGDVGVLSQYYAKLSEDLRNFADEVDPDLAKRWKDADEVYSDFATGANKTGAKSLIKNGSATPEVVDQLLFSKKQSDLDFLFKNLDDQARQASKQRILQRVLEKSMNISSTASLPKFKNAAYQMRKQINTFFDPDEKKAFYSLLDVLEKTKRAEVASTLPATGMGMEAFFQAANLKTLPVGIVQAMIETKPIRNLLIKHKAAKTARVRQAYDEMIFKEMQNRGILAMMATTPMIGGDNDGD